ncbi:alpha/beta hydrolase [Streptomyces sp. NPDC006335]|uniref:alpha/beta fold hydrolase n=1 Tax=Streptomyces sp. NPDC006335 TaxID=3156895 RepID=UPI0033AF379C
MHVAKLGTGPAVLFPHGFPTLWITWRHRITVLAAAGFRAIAPDQRGYGDTSVPSDVWTYGIEYLSGNVVRLLDALDLEHVVVVGHDWGTMVAWYTALMHPERVRAVAGVSVPFVPRTPVPPTQFWRETPGEDFYMLWLREPGVADALFDADVERAPNGRWVLDHEAWHNGPATDRLTAPTPQDQALIDSLKRNGWTGPLNWYRNFDRNWELLAPHSGRTIDQSALYIGGEKDPVLQFMPPSLMDGHVTDLRGADILPGVTHWIQEEAPDQVNRRLLDFLAGVSK